MSQDRTDGEGGDAPRASEGDTPQTPPTTSVPEVDAPIPDRVTVPPRRATPRPGALVPGVRVIPPAIEPSSPSPPFGPPIPADAWPNARSPEDDTAPLGMRVPMRPAIVDDDSVDTGEPTIVSELTAEQRALQRGYRKVKPLEALRKQLGSYDDSAEIVVLGETWMEGLMLEELVSEGAPSEVPLIGIEAHGRSDIGRKRKANEDSILLLDSHHTYLVADGMGGHAAGALASQTAVDTVRRAFTTGAFQGEPNVLWPPSGDELARTLEMANSAIFRKSLSDPELEGMGTTMCALRFSLDRQRAYVAHVGDSRCYRYRKGDLARLTTDHSMGEMYGVVGSVASHLCRAIGVDFTVEVDLLVDLPQPGDIYLLCSDGLTRMVRSRLISLFDPDAPLPAMVDAMIAAANDQGGIDNISVVLVRVTPP